MNGISDASICIYSLFLSLHAAVEKGALRGTFLIKSIPAAGILYTARSARNIASDCGRRKHLTDRAGHVTRANGVVGTIFTIMSS